MFEGLQHGQIDRALFTSNANAYFSDAALADFAAGLGPLGPPQEFEQASQSLRGGMTARSFRIKAGREDPAREHVHDAGRQARAISGRRYRVGQKG